jgi:hypothetical protein
MVASKVHLDVSPHFRLVLATIMGAIKPNLANFVNISKV